MKLYKTIQCEGRLDEVLSNALLSIRIVRDELIAWKLGMGGTALVHRKSYKPLCDAIDMLNKVETGYFIVPDYVAGINITYEEYEITDKRKKISRVKHLENAHNMISAIDDIIPHYAAPNNQAHNQFLYNLAVISTAVRIAIDLIPWRFEKKPKALQEKK